METVQKEMTLDVSIDDYNETAVRYELAALYGVDVSLITLDATAGSLQITITIAAAPSPPGAAASSSAASLSALIAAVEAVDDSALGASMSTALGTVINVTSTAPQQAQVKVIVEQDCPRGHWYRLHGSNSCLAD